MAGRDREAIPVLLTLADQEASDGFAAKAIAILKRIEKIEPGRRDVEDRLAKLIQDKSRRTMSVPKPANLPPTSSSGMSFGFEEIDSSSEIHLGVSTPDAVDSPAAEPDLGFDALSADAAFTPEPELPPPSSVPAPDSDLVAEFDDSFAVEPEAPAEAPDEALADADEEEAPKAQGLSTPLFDGFSPEELLAVMRGLELVSFEAGDVIVAEGAAGDSMFILTSGKVKAYVKTPKGKSLKVQEFEEGDFFGEISVLTGKPRTATLTAAVDCDCLELTRASLDEITKTHPGVREVLKRFQKERALSTVQAIMADKS